MGDSFRPGLLCGRTLLYYGDFVNVIIEMCLDLIFFSPLGHKLIILAVVLTGEYAVLARHIHHVFGQRGRVEWQP